MVVHPLIDGARLTHDPAAAQGRSRREPRELLIVTPGRPDLPPHVGDRSAQRTLADAARPLTRRVPQRPFERGGRLLRGDPLGGFDPASRGRSS
jgi:hypothetical protein